jgi:hypothetical protein
MSHPCEGECMCSAKRRLDWKSPVEDWVDRHNPEGVCIEHGGKCERVPCCKANPEETTEEGW